MPYPAENLERAAHLAAEGLLTASTSRIFVVCAGDLVWYSVNTNLMWRQRRRGFLTGKRPDASSRHGCTRTSSTCSLTTFSPAGKAAALGDAIDMPRHDSTLFVGGQDAI